MKKALYLFVFLFATCFASFESCYAQNTDTSSVSYKSNQITNFLTSKLKLSATQTTAVQSLVTDYASKFSKSNASVSSSKGLKEKVEEEGNSKLATEFSNELPKLLNSTQAAQFASVKDKVSSMFKQIK